MPDFEMMTKQQWLSYAAANTEGLGDEGANELWTEWLQDECVLKDHQGANGSLRVSIKKVAHVIHVIETVFTC